MPSTSPPTSAKKSKNAPGAKAGPASFGDQALPQPWTMVSLLTKTTLEFGQARIVHELLGAALVQTRRLEVKGLKDSTWRDAGLVTQTPDMRMHITPGPRTLAEDTRRLARLLG